MTNTIRRLAELALALSLATPAAALDLALPSGARLMAERVTDPGSYSVPTGPWRAPDGVPATSAEGRIVRQAWRIDATDLTTLQILAPLREQIEAAGYTMLLDCDARACGGFDFRFGTEVMRAPDMYVALTAYRFLSARGPEGDYLTLLVSRSAAAGYVQVIRAGTPEEEDSVAVTDDAPPVLSGEEGDLAARLETHGHVILHDLSFETGSSDLGDGPIASLDALAEYLRARPGRRIVFVGHTDTVGSLDANTALSRKRATAALRYLRDRQGIPADRIGAEGVGYLAPVASNLTQAGREENRRVEAVLIPAAD